MRTILFYVLLLYVNNLQAQTIKILFDATKAEMAGNADWVIDADVHDIGSNSSGAMVAGLGDEANPQGIPTPAQSGITASTPETFWTGALSAWAVDCAKKGYHVETLPNNDSITYGNTSHAKDLSKYDVYIVCEPNILFSASEKNAIVKFVKNGGGLFIISDHDMSDRNGDGYDSPTIWNNLFTTNTVQANPFGFTFDLLDFSQTSTNVATLPTDSCLHGPMGNVTKVQFSDGTSMTLNPANNNTVKGIIYKNGASTTGTTQVLFASAYYGQGKVCALGDSSPPDDGTGDPNDVLYNGYTGDAGGEHQLLLMNATIWLATNHHTASAIHEMKNSLIDVTVFPNPSDGNFNVQFYLKNENNISFEVMDLTGNIIFKNVNKNLPAGQHTESLKLNAKGFLLLKVQTENGVVVKPLVVN